MDVEQRPLIGKKEEHITSNEYIAKQFKFIGVCLGGLWMVIILLISCAVLFTLYTEVSQENDLEWSIPIQYPNASSYVEMPHLSMTNLSIEIYYIEPFSVICGDNCQITNLVLENDKYNRNVSLPKNIPINIFNITIYIESNKIINYPQEMTINAVYYNYVMPVWFFGLGFGFSGIVGLLFICIFLVVGSYLCCPKK